ncbi:MAG: replication initiator protein A [Acidobacteriaceae bacterium]|nr:replication initiator protein A [Acidobacteriaceae bacterium]
MNDLESLDPELAHTLQRLGDAIKNKPHTEETQPKPPTKIIQLPLWPEPVRGAPNTLLRSAFFAAIHSKKRRKLGSQTKPEEEPEGVIIAAQDGISIKYAGTQLNQYDADVFFEALHRARHHPLETECFFRGYDFLKAIGRSDAEGNYEDLDHSLRRLRNGTVDLEWKINGRHYIFTGSLVASYVREKNSKLYKITFAKEIRDLFGPACWTQLEWEERMLLKGHPIAQWLHSFYSSHAEPFPLSLAYLHQKTGSTRPLLKNFRTDLKNALTALEKKLGWKTIWKDDLLTIVRRPSAAQIRHLNNKAGRSLPPQHRKRRKKTAPLFDFPELTGR